MTQNKLLTTQYANLFKYINTTEKDIYNLYITHLNMSAKARNFLEPKPQCTNVIHPSIQLLPSPGRREECHDFSATYGIASPPSGER